MLLTIPVYGSLLSGPPILAQASYPEGWATGVALPMIFTAALIVVAAVVKAVARSGPPPDRARTNDPEEFRLQNFEEKPSNPEEPKHQTPGKRNKLSTEQTIAAILLADPDL